MKINNLFGNKPRIILLTATLAFLSGCNDPELMKSSSKVISADEEWYLAEIDKDFTLRINDNSRLERFELELVSQTNREICIELGDWPASEEDTKGGDLRIGSLHFSSDYVYVLSDGIKNPIKASNFGYCIPPVHPTHEEFNKSCATVVQPNQMLPGIIPYSEFEQAINFSHINDKELNYKVFPYFCDADAITTKAN